MTGLTFGAVLSHLYRVGLAVGLSAGQAGDGAAPRASRDLVADGVFTGGIEGPAVGPDGHLYVVNFAREGTIGRVVVDRDGRGRATLFLTLPAGSVGNGIRFLPDGRMLVADYKRHRILAVPAGGGPVATYADLPDAHQPNDLAVAPDGDVYASDPDWATGAGRVWRVPRSGRPELVAHGIGTANGVEVSPDGRRLYVAESVQRRIWTYDRGPDGGLANRRLLVAFADHGLDGMRCDVAGNLYVTRHGAGEVAVVAPDGRVVRRVALKGRTPSNLAFGGRDGRDVYVTLQDRGAIETFRSDRPGRETGLP